jgi:methylmalonyl-CoA/ethylmalonyl-CoA epimerase
MTTPLADATLIRSIIRKNVQALDHLAIAVPDIEASLKWFAGVLGFEVIERRATRGLHTAMMSAVLRCGPVVLVLVQGTEPASQISKFISRFGPGVQHVALRVDDLDQTLGALRLARFEPDTPIIQGRGIRQVFLHRDQDAAVRLELIERRGGDFDDETIGQLFRAFESRDLY